MRRYRVRVWCLTASYWLRPIFAESAKDAIRAARRELRAQGHHDMAAWNFSVSEAS
jgi:hypothetical protein